MSRFSASWLALREAYDHRATATAPLFAIRAALADRRPLRALDLGAGSGAAIRLLAPLLPKPQEWLAVECDPTLVAEGRRRCAESLPAGVRVRWKGDDLARTDTLSRLLHRPVDLVSASALLDLVSRSWLAELVAILAASRTLLWTRLTFDGRIHFFPPDPFDRRLVALLCAHQRRDKGFGPAVGPEAVTTLAELLAPLAGRMVTASSDWRLGPRDRAIQEILFDLWAEAAASMAPQEAEAITGWRHRRLTHLRAGRSHLTVGHRDLAWLPGSAA